MNKLYAAWLNREAQTRLGKHLCDLTTEDVVQIERAFDAERTAVLAEKGIAMCESCWKERVQELNKDGLCPECAPEERKDA
jgi:hypothetical protein